MSVRVRAVDQYGQIIDGYVSARRDTRTARRFFTTVLDAHGEPMEIVTDRAPAKSVTGAIYTVDNGLTAS